MRKEISHEEKENQNLLENLEEHKRKMEGAQEKYQRHLQGIRVHSVVTEKWKLIPSMLGHIVEVGVHQTT